MGLNKKRDGRYVVGIGIENGNEYKGSAGYRDMVIQYTADGATDKSMEYLEYLRDYALYHSEQGNPVVPPNVSVWLSTANTMKAVEADDVSVDGSNFSIGAISWDGSNWTFGEPTSGGGSGSSLPPYTSADEGKALTVEVPESTVIPAQTTAFTNGYGTVTGVDFSALKIGDVITFTGTVMGQSLSFDGEVVADGDNVQIVSGNGYFKADGSAYIEELAEVPSISVTADAVTVTGDATASWNFPALVVKAKGTATIVGSMTYTITVGVNVTAEKIAECFTPDKAKPVFVLVPAFGTNEPYYDYDTYNQMFLLNNCSEAYLFGDSSAPNYCKYDGTNNTIVYHQQGAM